MLLKTKAEEHPIKKLDETQTINFEDATLGMYNGDWELHASLLTCNIASLKICDSIRFSVLITDQTF